MAATRFGGARPTKAATVRNQPVERFLRDKGGWFFLSQMVFKTPNLLGRRRWRRWRRRRRRRRRRLIFSSVGSILLEQTGTVNFSFFPSCPLWFPFVGHQKGLRLIFFLRLLPPRFFAARLLLDGARNRIGIPGPDHFFLTCVSSPSALKWTRRQQKKKQLRIFLSTSSRIEIWRKNETRRFFRGKIKKRTPTKFFFRRWNKNLGKFLFRGRCDGTDRRSVRPLVLVAVFDGSVPRGRLPLQPQHDGILHMWEWVTAQTGA